MEKGFFKVFSPETSAKQMKMPPGYNNYKSGKLPNKISLRDRFGNMWPIGVAKTGRDIYFQYGWEKFVKDNNLEFGDFLIFDYNENKIFDFKLLGTNGCEKKGIGGLQLALTMEEAEEVNVEHQKSVVPNGKNWTSDSNKSSSDDDSDKDSLEEEDKEYDETKKVPRSKRKDVEDEQYNDDEEEEENEKEEKKEAEEKEENERLGRFNKQASHLKAGRKRSTARKVRNLHDSFGTDIFKSGRATQPKNPYFVANVQPKRKDQLYVPTDVLRDYKLELPSSMTIRDSTGREFETKVTTWKDSRIWLVGGWRSFCRWNLVEKNDKCICEFVREKHNKGLYLQVNVLYEGSSSQPSKKSKK